jgi:very-short-patch-repair endonuclease
MDSQFDVRPEVRQRLRQAARTLRGQATSSEVLLWKALRNRKLGGRKFRRQHPVGPFVVDFYCHEERLVIEVDGPVHRRQAAADRERQQLLEASGLRVLRVRSEDIETDIEAVLSKIRSELGPSPPAPLPQAGEG